MVRHRVCRHRHNTHNSKHLILHNTASSREWQLQHPTANKGPTRHSTNPWFKATTRNSLIPTVGRPTRTPLLVPLAIRPMCIRGSLLTTAGTCCHPSKSHPKNLRGYRTSRTSLSSRRHEASRRRHMLEGRNTIHISNLWRLLQHLVHYRKTNNGCYLTLSPSWIRRPNQSANDYGRARRSRSLLHSRRQDRPSDQTRRSNLLVRQNHVLPRQRVRFALCRTSCQS